MNISYRQTTTGEVYSEAAFIDKCNNGVIARIEVVSGDAEVTFQQSLNASDWVDDTSVGGAPGVYEPLMTKPIGYVRFKIVSTVSSEVIINSHSFYETVAAGGGAPTPHSLNSFTNTAGISEKGETVNNFSLNWSYNRNGDDPTSQTINQGIGPVAVGDRSFAVVGAGLTSNTTYNISAVGDDANPSSRNTTIQFQNRVYFGVDDALLTTDTEVITNIAPQNNPFATSRVREITFDASQFTPPNYVYYCYPVAFGSPVVTSNGIPFNDFTLSTIANFDNGLGHTEDYYLWRANNQYSGTIKFEFN